MVSDQCGSSLLVALPEESLTIVNQFLSPKDVCNLGSCCRTLLGVASSDEIWITQCQKIGILPHKDLVRWRKGFASYKALFRFLASVQPLIGFWVYQNQVFGKGVYVIPSFLSVVGCRIIPQNVGPLGMEGSPILWEPLFEIIGDFDGSAAFFLHGSEGLDDHLCPVLLKAVDKTCNVLFLEVEARRLSHVVKLVRSQSFDHHVGGGISRSLRLVGKNPPSVIYSRMAVNDRSKLLQTVTCEVRLRLPYSTSELLFPRDGENFQQDIVLLSERRSLLMNLYKAEHGGGGYKKNISSRFCNSCYRDGGRAQCSKRKGVFGRLKQLVGISSSRGGDNKHAEFHEFLRSADAIGLTVRAITVNFSYCKGRLEDSHFVLRKLPVQAPMVGKEYAGVWGGTHGWRPASPWDGLFLALLSYEESEGKQLLIANKIMDGTSYVGLRHPKESELFTVNTDEEVSGQTFPWDADVLHSFSGKGLFLGIPRSKPGSLFVIEGGLLVWKQPEEIFTLKRLDLLDLLKKGEQVPTLYPVLNFYSNTST